MAIDAHLRAAALGAADAAAAWRLDQIATPDDLARVLRALRRRHARQRGGAELTYRELAAATRWSHGIIGEYLSGRVLPATDRFDVLVRLLGATPAEQGALATARDRVEEARRHALPGDALVARVRAPRQLPVDVPAFTGRAGALAELDALLAGGGPAVVTGTAGVGKTALVVHWAHRAAGRYPDGQLYVDLRGYDPGPPVPAADALAGFLRALGVAGPDVPGDPAERAACLRTVLSGRRVLLVLDNASGAEQVRPLLPGTPSCAAVVTSRDALAGLVARDGARRVDLGTLPIEESVALLRTLAGPGMRDAAALAERCARLPLALRIAAEFAVAHPDLSTAELLGDLDDERSRLDLLDTPGDPRTAIRSVFSWSYQHLTAAGARVFALLGGCPVRDIEAYAVAALAGVGLPGARFLVDELARAHLIEPAGHGRYAMHDLLRAYAVERFALEVDAGAGRAALTRLFGYHLHTAGAAVAALFPHDGGTRPAVPPATGPAPRVDTPARAVRWLDGQRPALVAAGMYAAGHGWPRHAVELSMTLWRHFEVGGHYQDALALHTGAAHAAAPADPTALADPAALADRAGQTRAAGHVERQDVAGHERACVLANLGGVHWSLGNHRLARRCFEESLAGHRAAGDHDGQARALSRLGLVHESLGEYDEALARLDDALAILRRTGNRHGEGAQLLNLGALHRRHGRYPEAAEHHRRAAAIFVEIGDARLEGYALGNLGADLSRAGQHAAALLWLRRSLANCRACGDVGGEGSALATFGAAYHRMGRQPEALDHLHRALAVARRTGERALQTEVLNALGDTLCAMGRPDAALDRFAAALALAERAGDRYERARALEGIANALDAEAADLDRRAPDAGEPRGAVGRAGAAREHRERALASYQALGVPEAERVRARLAGTPP